MTKEQATNDLGRAIGNFIRSFGGEVSLISPPQVEQEFPEVEDHYRLIISFFGKFPRRKKGQKVKLILGPCANCGKKLKIQKLWCSIGCQIQWELQAR